MIVPVILSGGSGTRLWPLSRPRQPKQLLAMVDERTMLRATFDRLDGIPEMVDPWVVCNADHHHLVARELFDAGFNPNNVILEPVGRNTAPAAAAAALVIAARAPDALMLLLPADHVMQDDAALHAAVAAAAGEAAKGKLATFGIVPGYPETGYGYIEVGARVTDVVSKVAKFVEKPDFETAQHYVDTGRFLWNSGMFLFAVNRYLEELERFAPEMLHAVTAAVALATRDSAVALEEENFRSCPSDSIDFAVMEHTDSAVVVPLDAGWSDVGSWAALWELSQEGGERNVMIGDVAAIDVSGSYLRAESRLLAAIGVEDLIVIETPDAVMVAPRDRSQDVKAMVDLLNATHRPEAKTHRKARKAWGYAELLVEEPEYAVRRLTIEPSSEPIALPASTATRVILVAAGTGIVEVDGETVDIARVGATIPAGGAIGVAVKGTEPLQLIEISRPAQEELPIWPKR